MNEAKPQDGSTVKGYRTLTADDIAQMNNLKQISRDFCEKLDIERTHLSLETVEAGPPGKRQSHGGNALSGYRPHQDAGSLHVGLSCGSSSECGLLIVIPGGPLEGHR